MLKLVQNGLRDLKNIISSKGKSVSWNYFLYLYSLHEQDGLSFVNKLNSDHHGWQKEKKKVKLAAQTFHMHR